MNEIIQIKPSEYNKIKTLVYNKFGINLGDKKQSLVIGRLNKVLRQYGFTNFSQYYDHLLGDKTGTALDLLVNRISTNHTYFYRENEHFIFFQNRVLKEIKLAHPDERFIRVWSAGCSSGEEPYTLAMLMQDFFGVESINKKLKVLGTDISKNALEKAIQAKYLQENISKMPARLKNKYFIKEDKEYWRVSDQIKEMVLFRRLNFMRDNFPFKRKFHCIFCRNVMIYFDPQTREKLVAKFAQFMESNSYFFIGLSESLGRLNTHFKYIQPGIYQKIG